jgi:Sulfatase-modifying factor enzyme 1
MTLTPMQADILPPATEPALVRVPEGRFLMGSDSGQDCERPVHRVWIDSFLLAATQVTNAEYERFLHATAAQPPPFWNDANFNHPQQPVAGASWLDAARYCACPRRPSGSARRVAGANRKISRGVTNRRNLFPSMRPAGRPVRRLSHATRPTLLDFMIFVTTSTSGAATGTIRITTRVRRSAIRGAPRRAIVKLRAEDRGGIT